MKGVEMAMDKEQLTAKIQELEGRVAECEKALAKSGHPVNSDPGKIAAPGVGDDQKKD